MINPIIIRAMANSYTDESMAGAGAVKGKNCTIQSIVSADDKSVVTFAWTLDDGTVKTEQMTVKDGESAYKIAVRLGFVGTEAEWIESLKGDSAYDIAVEEGYVGTKEEWIASLKGEKGDRGASIASAEFDENHELVFTLDDEEGTKLDPVTMPPTTVEISKEPGNVAENKPDGFYVPKGAVEISKEADNSIESKADGLYSKKVEISTAFGDTTSDDKAASEKLVKTELDKKVDSETGKGLSTNDLTDELKAQYDKAEENVQADWNQTDNTQDDYIKNKPTVYGISADADNALKEGTDGELFVPKADAQVQADWTQTDTTKPDYIKNKLEVVSAFNATTSDDKVPSEKLTKDELDKKVNTEDISTAFDATTSDDKVPSEKLVKGELDKKIDAEKIVTEFGEIPSDDNIPSEKLVYDSIEHFDERIDQIELFKFPNAVIHGEPVINNGQVSGFSAVNYLAFPFLVDFHNRTFTIDMAFATGADVTTQQNIIDGKFGLALAVANGHFLLAVSTDGETWDVGVMPGVYTVLPNTNYYLKLIFDGTQYKLSYSLDGETYVDDISHTSSASPYPVQVYIGVGDLDVPGDEKPFLGIINMNKSLLLINDQVVWQGMDDAGLSTRLATDLDNVDELGIRKIKQIAETDKKVDIQQSVDDAGKVLSIGADGKITPKALIDDADTTSTDKTWSVDKIKKELEKASWRLVMAQTIYGITVDQYMKGDLVFALIHGTTTGVVSAWTTWWYAGVFVDSIFVKSENNEFNFHCNQSNGIKNIQEIPADYTITPVQILYKVVVEGEEPTSNDIDAEILSNLFVNLGELSDSLEDKADKLETAELKMLGWNVPKECPIQNEVSGNKFIQKVGRSHITAYANDFTNVSGLGGFDTQLKFTDKCYSDFSDNIISDSTAGWYSDQKCISAGPTGNFRFYTELNSYVDTYLYYELETPITITIDGNELSIGIKYYNSASTEKLDCDNLTDPICLVSPTFLDDWAERHFPFNDLTYIRTNRNKDDGVQEATSYHGDRRAYRTMVNNEWQPWQDVSPLKYIDVLIEDVTIPTEGYYNIKSLVPTGMNHFLFCVVWDFGQASGHAFDVNANGQWLRGEVGMTITHLTLRYFYM